MKIVNINIRGLGGDVKRKYLRELVSKEDPGLLLVQETKLTKLDDSKCYSLWGSNDISWIHRGADKEGGGILTLWDNKKFTCSRSEEGKGFILTEGMYKSGDSVVGVKVIVLNVYALCSNSDKVVLWRDIECLLGNGTAHNRCLIGDFNSVRVALERKETTSGTVNKYEMARFNDFIERYALRDIPVVGRQFTWYRPNGTTRSRLDRALISDEWLQQWQGSKQYVQGRQVSDHWALVIKKSILDWGPKPFRTFDV